MKLKMLFSTAVATVALAAALPASAVPIFPVFQVNPGVGEAGTINPFSANDLGGQYNELITFTSATAFNVSLIFKGAQFNLDDTAAPVSYNANETGLGKNYGLYATFLGAGTYSTVGTTTTFNLASGDLNLYIDTLLNTTFAQPADGTTVWGTGSTGDDALLGFGTNATGSGTSLGTNCPNNNCGSFGQTTPFQLTAAGSSFFVAPVPFYNLALTSGQFQGINPPVAGTTIQSTGTANTVFQVPEPSPLALLGLGLVALGFSRRRSTKA